MGFLWLSHHLSIESRGRLLAQWKERLSTAAVGSSPAMPWNAVVLTNYRAAWLPGVKVLPWSGPHLACWPLLGQLQEFVASA